MGIGEVVLRVVVAFVVLAVVARLQGNKEAAHMTFFNFVAAATLAAVAGALSVHENLPIVTGATAIVAWGVLLGGATYVTLKSPRLRQALDGEPLIIIQNGKIVRENMAKNRYNMSELMSHLREQGVFSLKEVAYAILETNGKLSILKHPAYQQVTRKDLGIEAKGPSGKRALGRGGEILEPTVSGKSSPKKVER